VLLPKPTDGAWQLARLERYDEVYSAEFCTAFAAKLGLRSWQHDDVELLEDLFELMHPGRDRHDRVLPQPGALDIEQAEVEVVREAFYRDDLRQRFAPTWRAGCCATRSPAPRTGSRQNAAWRTMNAANPRYVLRNYLAQQAIDRAEQGDTQMIHELLEVLRRPYDEQPGREAFSAKRPDWARHRAGCSTLSCSS
jgi:uncharacterized protein YdiU (UPF0061 family)